MNAATNLVNEEQVHILFIEDNRIDQKAFERWIIEANLGYSYTIVNNLQEAIHVLANDLLPKGEWQIIISDYMLPDGIALDILPYAEGCPVIVVTSQGDEVIAVNAMKSGAYDYVVKDLNHNYFEVFPHLINNALMSKLAHNARKIAEEKLSLVFEASPDAIIVTTFADGNIIDYNAKFSALFGLGPFDLVGQSSVKLGIWHDSQQRQRFIDAIQAQGSVRNFEVSHKSQSGRVRHVLVSAETIILGGELCILSIIRDITLRVEIEKQREQLIAELDAFAHTVAHDLKGPLNIITGYASLLNDSLDDPEASRTFVQGVSVAAYKMGNIIDELLRFAQYNRTGQVDLHPIDTEKVVFEVKKRLAWLIDENHAEIIEPDEWLIGLGYEPWIEEVWTNYISNAIKYGGTLPILQLGSNIATDGMLRFWVKDNGKGLTQEEQSKLFNEFSRLNIRVKGHGLGLSIVKRIVERLGGTVGVESNINEGSLFYFTLPQIVP